MENYESCGMVDITTGKRETGPEMRKNAPVFMAESCDMPDLTNGNRIAYDGRIITDTSANHRTRGCDRE